MLNVYRKWRKALADGLKQSHVKEREWCNRQMLDLKCLKEMHQQIEDIQKRLAFFKISTADDTYRFSSDEKLFTIKICIAGAFIPNFFKFGGSPPWKDEFSVLNGFDPCKTVYFKGFSSQSQRIGQLYETQIRQKLVDAGISEDFNEMKIHFDGNSSRVQVQFKPFSDENSMLVPGEVLLEVYKALKLHKLERCIEIKVMK